MFEKLGDYTLLARIGKGGMGVVYRAFHDRLGQVAIKLLPDAGEDARGRLLREAAVAASLEHPQIIRVYGFGEHKRRPYIVMELLNGISLKTMIKDVHAVALERRLDVMKQVLQALVYAHEAGVAHRDIKPQNIFVTRDGSVRVLDFGLARVDDSPTVASDGRVGTPGYMPPEQVLRREVDYRGEVFSAGTVFYELLSGTRAFSARGVRRVFDKVTGVDPVPVHRVDERMPEELSMIVRTAMAKDPDERYQSMREMLDAVERFETTLAARRDEMRGALAAQLARLGPIPAHDTGPPELEIPTVLPDGYLELLALQQRMETQREPFEGLVRELVWVGDMLAAPLEQLGDDALRAIANRADCIRELWPRAPRVAELGRRVMQELRARLSLRDPVMWGNAGRRPRP